MNKEYKEKLLDMAKEDKDLAKKVNDPHILFVKSEKLIDLRNKNIEKLKDLIEEYGFPTKSLVGEEGHDAAFYLFNRSIHDIKFISNMYKKISKLSSKEINLIEYAYLEDKLNFYSGKPQVYGTKFYHNESGEYIPWKILEESEVNKRRLAIGLESLEDQVKNKTNKCIKVVEDEVLQLKEKREDRLREIGWLK